MRRREFIRLGWREPNRGEQIRRLGVLQPFAKEDAPESARVEAFLQELIGVGRKRSPLNLNCWGYTDIKYLAVSHTHPDHIGNVEMFPQPMLLVQKDVSRDDLAQGPKQTSGVCFVHARILNVAKCAPVRESTKCRFRPRRRSTANVSSAARVFGLHTSVQSNPSACVWLVAQRMTTKSSKQSRTEQTESKALA